LQHSGRGPGRFAARFLTIEHKRMQSSPREFPRNRTANDAAANY
jgi:hypothetical protein